MGEFKKFIKTTGKSIEEIKKAINDMVGNAVDNIVDTVIDDMTQFVPDDVRKSVKKSVRDARKKSAEVSYKAEKIPDRKPSETASAEKVSAKKVSAELDEMARFVEDASRHEQWGVRVVAEDYKSEKIPDSKYTTREYIRASEMQRTGFPPESLPEHLSEQDEYMVNKIRKMRELEMCVRENGVYKRAFEITQYEQGEFMANVEDDFPRRAFCGVGQVTYACLSRSQLRTYFTWRTDVRRGVFRETDKPYVMLYCGELIHKIGADGSADAFRKLLATWDGCRNFAPYLDEYMPRWLKDFYAFNDIEDEFPDINAVISEHGGAELEKFPDTEFKRFSDEFDFLAENSVYPIKSSAFYSEKTRPMLEGACKAALMELEVYFKQRGIELSSIIFGKLKKDYTWKPFQHLVINLDAADGFHPVKISAGEIYCQKRGEPALELFSFAPCKGFNGYLLKSVEARLRQKTGYSRKISANLKMALNDFQNRTKLTDAVSAPEFLEIIPKAVDEYCLANGIKRAPKRTAGVDETVAYTAPKVEIDVSKLADIRAKSDETARKLIIDDGIEKESEGYRSVADKISDDDFSNMIEDCKRELSPLDPAPQVFREQARENPAFSGLSGEWREFANSLTDTHIQVLKALLEGNVRSFCDERHIFAELVYEEINTLSLSAMGDVVIECGELVGDYREDIQKIVSC